MKQSTKTWSIDHQGFSWHFYRAALLLSVKALNYASRIIRGHPGQAAGSR
jgi:hypothetical protein